MPKAKINIKHGTEGRFILVTWPYSQLFMEIPGWVTHSHLANDEIGYERYGPAAYFVEEEWLRKHAEF
mgnify:CR=1 FL=1